MLKKHLRILALALIVGTSVFLMSNGSAFAATHSASTTSNVQQRVVTHPAEPAMADLCKSQSSGVEFISYSTVPPLTAYAECSGYYNLNGFTYDWMFAHNWSGEVYADFGTGPFWTQYCDENVFGHGKYYTLYLSPVREPGC